MEIILLAGVELHTSAAEGRMAVAMGMRVFVQNCMYWVVGPKAAYLDSELMGLELSQFLHVTDEETKAQDLS